MMRTRHLLPLVTTLVAALGSARDAQAQIKSVLVKNGFSKPLYVCAPEGDTRLFVVEQTTARIKIIKNGQTNATPFLDILSKVNVVGNERGLLGMAFSPDFATNGYFY